MLLFVSDTHLWRVSAYAVLTIGQREIIAKLRRTTGENAGLLSLGQEFLELFSGV
ncbi:hypothetical protein HMPREF1207_01076 [Paenibacillus sp. HGH0039]|nr:hypothetical protein HMPREF1207_01076 [Paenibacillus sp. HGH0039]